MKNWWMDQNYTVKMVGDKICEKMGRRIREMTIVGRPKAQLRLDYYKMHEWHDPNQILGKQDII